jgi:hypothetical protein
MSGNTEKWIGGARGESVMVEKEIDEIGRMGRLKEQDEDGTK